MKGNVIFILLIFAVVFPSKSQVTFGFNAGMNISNILVEKTDYSKFIGADWQPIVGLRAGINMEFPIRKKIGLRTELNYSQAGGSPQNFDDFHVKVQYVSLPIALYYRLGQKFKIYAGPEINFLLGAKTNFSYSFYSPDDFESIDWGVQLGMEFLPLNKIGVSVRNYFGMKYNSKFYTAPVQNGDPVNRETDFKTNRNNIFQINLTYYLLRP